MVRRRSCTTAAVCCALLWLLTAAPLCAFTCRCLKAPLHLSGIAQLLRTYPDAHVVWMHRDPVHVVTSYANLKATATASTMGSHRWNQDNVTRVGPEVMDMLHSVLTDALKDRDSLPQEVQQRAFVDVTYHDFVADPAGVSCRIARHVGIACDEAELRV